MGECIIGYFKENGKTYAGKNREPGKNSLDVLVVRYWGIESPKLIYIGMDPGKKVLLSEEILEAIEKQRMLDLKEDLDITLYNLEARESIPLPLVGKLSDNIWGGIYPSKLIGMPSSSPAKIVYILPANSDILSIENTSHYNLARAWGGINESGLFIQSSSIRHDNRLENRPSYSVITSEMLRKFEDVDEAISFLEERVKHYPFGAANFLISNSKKQAIVEYMPADVLDQDNPSVSVTSNLEMDFRSNFAMETELKGQVGFFERIGWNLENAKTVSEIQNCIRSLNRAKDALDNAGTEDIFSSHTVYVDLIKNKEILNDVLESVYKGEFRDISLSNEKQSASFYSICTHPIIENIPWHKEVSQPTYKRTFWNMRCELESHETTLKYDNPCQGGAEIVFTPKDVKKILDEL